MNRKVGIGSNFPKLLFGPILRRAEPNQVCIWVACSMPVTVRAEVFRQSDLQLNFKERRAQGYGLTKSLRLGQHLHVALVIARPEVVAPDPQSGKDIGFPTDTLLAYDIEITPANGEEARGERLADLGLTTGKNAIVYSGKTLNEQHLLPTFFIRGRGSPLNIVHGSCRKLHGKGQDCLVVADELISSSPSNLAKRPSVLFLTGDQIYADDVAEPLASYVTQLRIRLLGWNEKIMGINKKVSEIKPGNARK